MRDEGLNSAIGLAVCGGTMAFLWFFVAGAIRWTSGPMLSESDESRAARTFRLTDLIWLVLQMQMAMEAVSYAFPREMPGRIRATALVLFALPVALFWLAGLLVVSRAGIERPLRRAAVFVVVMPGIVVTMMGVPLLALGLLRGLSVRQPGDPPLPEAGPIALQLGGVVLFSLCLRAVAQWAVARERR
jgi:hypothetical protein